MGGGGVVQISGFRSCRMHNVGRTRMSRDETPQRDLPLAIPWDKNESVCNGGVVEGSKTGR